MTDQIRISGAAAGGRSLGAVHPALAWRRSSAARQAPPLRARLFPGELSQLLGATRPKVNAAIASLERAGAVRRTQDRLFCDPIALARIAQRPEEA